MVRHPPQRCRAGPPPPEAYDLDVSRRAVTGSRTRPRLVVAGITACALLVAGASAVPTVHAAIGDGEPAPGFGTAGVVIDGAISTQHPVQVIDVIEVDGGRLVAAANVATDAIGSTVVVRYLADGTRDSGFGVGGLATVVASGFPTTIAELPDGSYLVGVDGSSAQALYRVSPDGRTVAWVSPTVISASTALPDGSLIATERGSEQPIRILPSGVVDTAFATDTVPKPAALSSLRTADIVVLPDGRFLTSTAFAAGFTAECRITAFLPSGRIDTTFGAGGQLVVADMVRCPLDLRPDGSLLVTRTPYAASGATDTSIVAVDAGGSVSGAVLTTLDPGRSHPIEVSGDGRMFAGGATETLAFDANGAPDSGFGSAGVVPFPGQLSGLRVLERGGLVAWGVPSAGSSSIVLQRLTAPAGVAPRPPVTTTSRFVPLPPERILDTRIGLGSPTGLVGPNGQIDLDVTGVGGVPHSGVTAIVLNVTVTDTASAGFVSVFPGGSRQPVVSSINVDRPGATAPNLVTVAVGAGGTVTLFSSAASHLLADVAGYYTPAASSAGGRFVPAAPDRILDTRTGVGVPAGKPGDGGMIDLIVLGSGPVPASGVSAVVLNLTATEASGAGFVTAWPTGFPQPVVSNLNVDAGDTRPNLAIVPIGDGGAISLYTLRSTHLLADVFGWFTDDAAPTGTAGLFVPVPPTRVLDSRERTSTPIPAATAVRLRLGGTTVVPPSVASAIVLNITATQATGPGFVAAVPSPFTSVTVSNLNLIRGGQTIANASIVPLSGEAVDLYTSAGGHLVVDIGGWYTAA
jgi:hypothetical protein